VIISWFSCGAASAVATKLALALYSDVLIVRCALPNDEHPDNERFAADCARWFGQPVIDRRNAEYEGCFDVWQRRRYMSGPHGAPCTRILKKEVRWDVERETDPRAQVFGFTAEEGKRADRFRRENPEVRLLTPLIEYGYRKQECYETLQEAGIDLPAMYGLGFRNNNCIGCVKATSPAYWAKVRQHFPERFTQIAELSHDLGARLARVNGRRVFIDEVPRVIDPAEPPESYVECSLLCVDET